MSWDVDEVLGWTFVGLLVLAMASAGLWGATALVKTSAADGAVDFCWVEYEAPLYKTTAHRPWRSDLTLSRTNTLDEGVKAALATNCKIGKP